MALDTPIPSALAVVGSKVAAPAGEVLRVLRAVRAGVAGGYSPGDSSRREAALGVKPGDVPASERCFAIVGGVLRAYASGGDCWANDEGVRFLTLSDAFDEAQGFGEVAAAAALVAEEQVGLQFAPSALGALKPLKDALWVMAPDRQLPFLLQHLDRAIARVSVVVKRR